MKTAVVLFNLGGPDSLDAVKPFLRNLFGDPAIIAAPTIVRWPLAWFISSRRAPVARDIYARIGGRSPILPQTQAQADALQAVLTARHPDDATRVFVAMRYWHPFSDAVAADIATWAPDRIVLLPLYPQMSTATSQSSIADWHRAARKSGLDVPTRSVCCYPIQPGFVAASVALVRKGMAKAGSGQARLLFSAHGLPEKIVRGGDPYQTQVEATARAIVAKLDNLDLDWSICYQSRVGPLKWIGPSTGAEIERAARDGKGVVLYPLAFVSEHSETLVELDIEYRELARKVGVSTYVRVSTVGTAPEFIDGLADLVDQRLAESVSSVDRDASSPTCPVACVRCPMGHDKAASLAWSGR